MARIQRQLLMGLAFVMVAGVMFPALAQSFRETDLHNFDSPPRGEYPVAGVIRDSAGNVYGTTEGGGAWNQGAVFKLDLSGHETILYSFTGGADGADPQSGVILDSAGNLYGTTLYGGTSKQGVVYMVSAAGQETVLYSFTGSDDGGTPFGGVIRDAEGNLYGTTYSGGYHRIYGVVFKLDTAGHETVLHDFRGHDGASPSGDLIRDEQGNFYGTTQEGGTGGLTFGGVVFKMDPAGKLTVLHNFTRGQDGSVPWAGVTRDAAGNLYGATSQGGPANQGIVFKLDAAGTEAVLYSFMGGDDGGIPYGGVILDPAGNLYGTTYAGGASGEGLVYKLSPSGDQTVLYSFTGGADGGAPHAGVIRDASGSLYGTTFFGGRTIGVVYKLNAAGQESVLYTFPGGEDGMYPKAGLLRDDAGNLYGTTIEGGGTSNGGTVYKVDAAGRWTVLYRFTGGADGAYPTGHLIADSAGSLYGTTSSGGASNAGVVYKLAPGGHQSVLYSFSGGADGKSPVGSVVRDAAGNLYGTTSQGGATGVGVVYKLDASGQETVLYSFTGGDDGSDPESGVTLDSEGNIYGATELGGRYKAGVVYRLSAAGQVTVLRTFTGRADGGQPVSGLLLDSAGNLYGTTYAGGTGSGVVYKLDTAGRESVLYTFTGGADGGSPIAGVTRDSAGNLYGTTSAGGSSYCSPSGCGIVYKLDPAGKQTVLYSFSYIDGANPYGRVLLDRAGSLYGTAAFGGQGNAGVVFRLDPQ